MYILYNILPNGKVILYGENLEHNILLVPTVDIFEQPRRIRNGLIRTE